MTQQILMILPSTEDEEPKLVGPFLTEATANAWADDKGIDPIRRVIRPLSSPTSIYGYGRHALIPSPTARRVAGPRGGVAGVLHDIYGPPPLPDMPTRLIAEDEGVVYHRSKPGAPWETYVDTEDAAGALAAWEAKKAEARVRDLATGGRPITSWIEEHADQLQRFVPQELPERPKEIEQ